ncbi:MAG: hypothetical protein GY943_39495, partial [Chloroflexi bacterium]|nr:hypothetical protein [Chloroflexota bacterium]
DYAIGERTLTYPSGAVRVYKADSINRLDAVEMGDSTVIADYAYDPINHLNSSTYAGNGLINQVAYDAVGRITGMTVNNGSSDIVDYGYGYDNVGNRTHMQRNHQPNQPTDVYEYDDLYQLVNVWYGADATTPAAITSYATTQNYDLDMLGNRLEVTDDGVTETYGANNGIQSTNVMNRYDTVDGIAQGYDVRGNMLNDGENVYTYDILNRQTSVDNGSDTIDYVYDARGRRIAKINGSVTTHFIYDTQYRVIEERDNSETVTATYTYGQGMDEPLTMARSGQTFYYHRDALGSITEVSNASGTIVERYEYDVYGTATIYDGSDAVLTATAIENPYQFAGRRYDLESGNYYYRARIYSPDLGRFLSEDPLGFDAGDYNLYRYVFNNPTNLTDPTGEFAFVIPWLIKAGTEAAVDALMQATINYFFDPNISTVNEAFSSINWWQVGWAGATGLIPGGGLARAAIVAAGDVVIEALQAWSRCEEYTPQQALFTFAVGVASEFIGEKLGDLLVKYGTPVVSAALKKLGFDDMAERLLRNADEVVEDVADDVVPSSPKPNVCSFSEDTPVLTDDGLIPIGEIVEGEEVLAYNEATGEIDYYPVIAVWSHEDPIIVHLTINGETIETTPEHPFHTASGEWLSAASLQIGDQIRDAAWGIGTVQAITFTTQPQTMYNFTVATAHTYFVGEGQWLVHNDCLGRNARDYAQDVASNATSRSSRPSTIAALETPDGRVFYGQSGHGEEPAEAILDVLNQHPFNFGCAEVNCLNRAIDAGAGLQGASITTVKIRGPLDNPIFDFQAPCTGGCDVILNRLGINVIGGQ